MYWTFLSQKMETMCWRSPCLWRDPAQPVSQIRWLIFTLKIYAFFTFHKKSIQIWPNRTSSEVNLIHSSAKLSKKNGFLDPMSASACLWVLYPCVQRLCLCQWPGPLHSVSASVTVSAAMPASESWSPTCCAPASVCLASVSAGHASVCQTPVYKINI